jgi:trans-aconitate methyltransferase
MVYGIPMIRRMMEKEPLDAAHEKNRWDHLLSQTHFSTYLGGTIEVEARNLLTAVLIKYYAMPSPSILDMGCAGGTLASALPSFSRYVGVDVSEHAVATARRDPDLARLVESDRVAFEQADLRQYCPDQTWNVIVFNEVLYYLRTEQAIIEVERYAKFLSPDGIFCITMKDDPKSHAIFRSLARQYAWLDGILSQRKAKRPGYRIRLSRERPAFLHGAFNVGSMS